MGLEAAFYGRVHSPPASWVLVLIPFAEELIHRSSLPVGPLPSEAEKGGGSAGPWASLICGHLETSSCTGIRLASIGEETVMVAKRLESLSSRHALVSKPRIVGWNAIYLHNLSLSEKILQCV